MRGDLRGLSVYDAAFVDGEGSTRLQQSIETIQNRGTKQITHQ